MWTRYAEQEMAAGNIMAVKHIFSRCLLDCPNVDLWFIYIRFIKKVSTRWQAATSAEAAGNANRGSR